MVKPSYFFWTFFDSNERWTLGSAHEEDVVQVREVKAVEQKNSRMHSMKMEIF